MKRNALVVVSVLVGIFVLIGLCVGSTSAAGKVYNWKLDTVMIEGRPELDVLKDFAGKVGELSNNRLIIDIYPGGSLGLKTALSLRNMRDGAVQLAMIHPDYFTGDVPALGGISVAGYESGQQVKQVVEAIRPIKKKIYEKWGTILLADLNTVPAEAWIGTLLKKPASQLSELAGRKIRTHSKLHGTVYEKAGCASSFLAMTDVYEGLKSGLIDGCLASPMQVMVYSWYDVAHYYVVDQYLMGPAQCDLVVSKKWYDRLPSDLQKVLLEAADYIYDKAWTSNLDPKILGEQKRQLTEKAGNQITMIRFSEDDMQQWVQYENEVLEEWARDNGDKPYVEDIYKAVLSVTGK